EREFAPLYLTSNEGLLDDQNYLIQFGYEDMAVLRSQHSDEVGVYNFLNVEDEIRIYQNEITVKVALDKGDMIGLNASQSMKNHYERRIHKASITIEEDRKEVNKNIKIQDEYLSLIENDLQEEVLVYEFLGEMNDETYRIFINAMTGKEEKLDKLSNTEINFDIQM